MSEDHRKRAALQAARSQPAAEPLSDEDSVELRSTRTASIPVAGERDAEEVPALPSLSDATPSWTTQPAADVLGSGPQSANCSAGTHGGDNTTEPKHTAPNNVDGNSTNHAGDGKLRDPGYLDRSQVGMTRTALAPDASDACVRITADAQAHCSVESFGERSVIRHYGRLDGVDDGQSGSSTPSMIESISDRPRSASPAPSDLLYRVFLGNPDEDRDIIPLVSISLDLAEVSEVNNPMAFLREVEVIQWLVVEHRRRQARAAWEHEECSDVTSFDTSWTGVDADLQRDTPARNDKKNSDTYHTVMLKVKACAMRVRRRWGNVLKVLRAIPTSLKSTYRVTFHAS
ncbi:uncharacterized protein C8Q71DRAFT_774460 [Rhodofomes roseus]|uniref:Uncharacterized protein n=1 Tax=Rhodofomes roseus TaxID=34475 RepID=A0ABQ8K8C0_9APHY|nr:uncharacterized protein C8Q71DRAFT_774460 [Rhodofomes roseus]KAH9833174.1 hypothetical protein C8Q71DRAFT_774460 [Rhodofomes roseus]